MEQYKGYKKYKSHLLKRGSVLHQQLAARRRVLLRGNAVSDVCFFQVLEGVDYGVEIGLIVVLLSLPSVLVQLNLLVELRPILTNRHCVCDIQRSIS